MLIVSLSYLKRTVEETCNGVFDNTRLCNQIASLQNEFVSRFQQFSIIEPAVNFILNPFNSITTSDVAICFTKLIAAAQNDIELEIIKIQNDLILKAHVNDHNFWKLVDENNYPLLRSAALKVLTYFGSTYRCESLFSNMKHVKSKHRNRITDSHLDQCLRIATSAYIPNYEQLVEKTQCQVSH